MTKTPWVLSFTCWEISPRIGRTPWISIHMALIKKTRSSPIVIAWTSEPFYPRLSLGAFVDLHETTFKGTRSPCRMLFGAIAPTIPTVLPFFGLLFCAASAHTTAIRSRQSTPKAWKIKTCSLVLLASRINLFARRRVSTVVTPCVLELLLFPASPRKSYFQSSSRLGVSAGGQVAGNHEVINMYSSNANESL